MLFIAWLYGEQNQVRPMFPPNTSQEDLIRASKMFDLAPQMPPVDWSKALQHLPEMDIIKAVDGPHGIFADRDGSVHRRRDDQARAQRSGLVSRRPVARRYDRSTCRASGSCRGTTCRSGRIWRPTTSCARRRKPEIANQQYAVIAPTLHCGYKRATEDTVVGEREHGRRAAGLRRAHLRLVRSFPEGRRQPRAARRCRKVRYFTMGIEQVADVGHLAARRARSR